MNPKNNPKKRKEFITATTVENTTSIRIGYDPQTHSLILHEADPKTVKCNISYDRASGKEKFLNVSPSGKQSASIDPNKNLENNFDHLCAIDTNTKMINNRKISISVAYHIPGLLWQHNQQIPLLPLCSYLIADVSEEMNPEVIGWHLFFKHKIKKGYFQNGRKLGLVVDCHLNSHDKINLHEMPYYQDYVLPEYATLIYASSDSGKEYLANQLLALCDDASKKILEHFEANSIGIPKLSPGDQYFSGFCEIKGIN